MTGQSEPHSEFHLDCKGELWAIRSALVDVEMFLSERGVTRSRITDLCLVLAEAMTNIARHAYRDSTGDISLTLTVQDSFLRCELTDGGVAFDPAALGHNAPDPAQFREGGYGWFIIRHLSEGLSYSRKNGRNSLSFSVSLDPVN